MSGNLGRSAIAGAAGILSSICVGTLPEVSLRREVFHTLRWVDDARTTMHPDLCRPTYSLSDLEMQPIVKCPTPIAILVAIALLAGTRVDAASSITSRTLIDPAGEHTGDEFGRSVAWVGDVNGDGSDDVLIGAFRYPEIASVGQAYLYFGGPAIDSVADSSSLLPPAAQGGSGSASPRPETSTATATRTSSSGRSNPGPRARLSSITAGHLSMRHRISR